MSLYMLTSYQPERMNNTRNCVLYRGNSCVSIMGCNTSTQHVIQQIPSKEEHLIAGSTGKCLIDSNQILEKSERELIRETWTMMSCDKQAIGGKVFLRIFELRPAIKQLFPFRDDWGDSLIKHELFLAHSLRFITIVEDAVLHMEGLEAMLGKPMFELGRTHIKHRGFTTDYFDCFLMSMLFIWAQTLKGNFPLEAHEAWKTLLQWMVHKLKQGYDYECYRLIRSGYKAK